MIFFFVQLAYVAVITKCGLLVDIFSAPRSKRRKGKTMKKEENFLGNCFCLQIIVEKFCNDCTATGQFCRKGYLTLQI